MLFAELWNSYLAYWQRYCQDTVAALPNPVNALTQMTPFAPFLSLSDPSDETDPAALWKNWPSAWQWPRIEAEIHPLEAADPTGFGDLARLSMRVFMPWDPAMFQVDALVSRQKTMTSHEVDIIPEIAETQQQALPSSKRKKT